MSARLIFRDARMMARVLGVLAAKGRDLVAASEHLTSRPNEPIWTGRLRGSASNARRLRGGAR